jgi:hypothetical protein
MNNKKKVYLIFHPSHGRTGTTWLQEYILPQTSVLNLGKGMLDEKKKKNAYQELKIKQSKVFSSAKTQNTFFYRYRNSWHDIVEYTDLICNRILEYFDNDRDIKDFLSIISDETIFGYGGFEVNSPLLVSLMNNLENKLSENDIEIEMSINITIREQIDFLYSDYQYDYADKKKKFPSFNEFLHFGVKNTQKDIFGQIMYWEQYSFLRSVLPQRYKINLIFYELLNEDPIKYLQSFFSRIPKAFSIHNEINNIEVNRVINANKRSSEKYYIRDNHPISSLLKKIRDFYSEKFDSTRNKIFTNILKKIFKLLNLSRLLAIKKYTKLHISEDDKINLEKLKDIYGQSNNELSRLFPKENLIKFNYIRK